MQLKFHPEASISSSYSAASDETRLPYQYSQNPTHYRELYLFHGDPERSYTPQDPMMDFFENGFRLFIVQPYPWFTGVDHFSIHIRHLAHPRSWQACHTSLSDRPAIADTAHDSIPRLILLPRKHPSERPSYFSCRRMLDDIRVCAVSKQFSG